MRYTSIIVTCHNRIISYKKGTLNPFRGLESFDIQFLRLTMFLPFEGILFAISGMKRIMVKSIFISIETIVKVVWYSFGILNKQCIPHHRRSTNGVSFIPTTITFYSFRVTEATTSQKEGVYELHKYYGS